MLEALTDLHVRDIGPGELARYDPDGRLLSNINTPRDYVAAQERTAE